MLYGIHNNTQFGKDTTTNYTHLFVPRFGQAAGNIKLLSSGILFVVPIPGAFPGFPNLTIFINISAQPLSSTFGKRSLLQNVYNEILFHMGIGNLILIL